MSTPTRATTTTSPNDLAKAALRQLMAHKLEPTPENYARAYRAEAGFAAAQPSAEPGVGERDAAALAGLIQRILRGVERGGRHWTRGRRSESLQRVLAGSRTDAQLLQRRLSQLVSSWDSDSADAAAAAAALGEADAPAAALPAVAAAAPSWSRVVASLAASLQAALPVDDASGVSADLAALVQAMGASAATAQRADEMAQVCTRAERVLQHRHHLVDQLGGLCSELTAGLGELAEDDSWAKGQLDAMRRVLDDGITARGVRSVAELLRHTREHQVRLRGERSRAREALKSLINQMLQEIGELSTRTGAFHVNVGRYADVIEHAESLESLTEVVGEMLKETRSVQEIVGQTQQRLQSEYAHVFELSGRVVELESQLRCLAEQVSTDPLTQVANRRGLMQAFEIACARVEREAQPLAIGLLDVDNFKRLNDDLGHSAGDEALRALAGVVGQSLRPADVVARFGGEEFVVLLPATPVDEGQQILTRLQRALSVGLFMHERKTVFVTFSAGVTAYRAGETMEQALERADAALYEAKRTGKNRTCVG